MIIFDTDLNLKKNLSCERSFGSRSTFLLSKVYKSYFSGQSIGLTKSLYKQNQSYLVLVVFVVVQKVLLFLQCQAGESLSPCSVKVPNLYFSDYYPSIRIQNTRILQLIHNYHELMTTCYIEV